MALIGADSELPQPDLYAGHDVWGVYIAGDVGHVWTHAEIKELGADGIRGVLPIIVPPQSDWWSVDQGAEVLVRLVAQARAWGLHVGSPLVLDIEEGTAEALGSLASAVYDRWRGACSTYGYVPWTYGGATWHQAIGDLSYRWLAEWPSTTPTSPNVPGGYNGWQYEGNAESGRIDRDVFSAGLTYLSPTTLLPEIVKEKEPTVPMDPETGAVTPDPEPVAPGPEPTPDADTPTEAEAEAVASATDAQATELEKTADAPPTPTHAAEIHDLTAKIRTHLDELDALADAEAPKS